MTVADLIAKLQEFPLSMEVTIESSYCEYAPHAPEELFVIPDWWQDEADAEITALVISASSKKDWNEYHGIKG